MKLSEMNEFVLSMEKIEAHEQLVSIRVSSYPHMEKKDQTKYFNELKDHTRLNEVELDAKDVAKALGFI